MRKFYMIFLLIILFAFHSYAGTEFPITGTDGPSSDSIKEAKKICSCQLVNVHSSKYGSQLIGLFAEKTLEGKKMINYKVMNEYIRREKLYFRIVFERWLEREDEIRASTDCRTLYNKLKLENSSLIIYNILDIDVLLSLVKK